MPNKDKIRKLEVRKNELVRNIHTCGYHRKKIINLVNEIKNSHERDVISYNEHNKRLNSALDNKSPEYWIKYYDEKIRIYNEQIDKINSEIIRQERKVNIAPYVLVFTILIILGAGLLMLRPTITGLIIGENITIEENITVENITLPEEIILIENITIEDNVTEEQIIIETEKEIEEESLVQGIAEINKPVKWIKRIKLKESADNLTIKLSDKVSDVKVSKIVDEFKEEIKDDKIKVIEEGEIKPIALTGYVIKQSEINEDEIGLIIDEEVKEVEIEYYTKGPEIIEKEIDIFKKEVTIYSELHYENILAYTPIKDVNKDLIKLYRTTNGIRELTEIINYKDSNNNGLIDEIKWIVPSLSNETYEVIIEISKAMHLSEDKEFISDIYNEVYKLDNVWSEEINSEEYIRITFIKNLTNENDITIYPRIVSGTPRIEVYESDKTSIIAEFSSLNENEYNKVFLTNLQGTQDKFDLKVLDGILQFNHIMDPPASNRTVYNFSNSAGTSHFGYTLGTQNLATPPAFTDARETTTQVDAACYTAMTQSDDSRCQSEGAAGQDESWIRMNFTIINSTAINNITITLEAICNACDGGENVEFIHMNYTNDVWSRFAELTQAEATRTITYTEQSDIANVLRDTQLVLLVEGTNLDSGESVSVDFVQVVVTTAGINNPPNAPTNLVINSTAESQLNLTNEDLRMNFYCEDSNNDVLTYHLTAFKDGLNQFQLQGACNDPEYKSVLLDNANTTEGDVWSFSVNVSDDSNDYSSTISTVVNITIETIPNIAPEITIPAFNQTSYTDDERINASLVVTDDNNDLTNITFEWFKNQILIERRTYNNILNGTNISDLLPRYLLVGYDIIELQAFAFDGELNSTLINSTAINIIKRETFDNTTLPIAPSFNGWDEKSISEIINETGITIPIGEISNITELSYSAKGITLKDNSKTLFIHQPVINGTSLNNTLKLTKSDNFTYNLSFENTRIQIEFENDALQRNRTRWNLTSSKGYSKYNWKIKYNYKLPSQNFKEKFRISSSGPIQILDNNTGKIKTGNITLDYIQEVNNGYQIEINQTSTNIIYLYLNRNYSDDGFTFNEEIELDPTLTVDGSTYELCGEVNQYDKIEIANSGIATICAKNATAGTGYANITLGIKGNFSLSSNSFIEGSGGGATGGAGSLSTSVCSTQGMNGEDFGAGTTACTANGGGGSGAVRSGTGSSTGGSGGGFGGGGGIGGEGATGDTQGVGGNAYGSSTGEVLYAGSGGGGSSGDNPPATGAAGGAGLRINASAGWITIYGIINISGVNGSDGDSSDNSGGGGGSGGHIILESKNLTLGSSAKIFVGGAKGGNGAGTLGGTTDSCGGGGGGGGRILYIYDVAIISNTFANFTTEGNKGYGTDSVCDAGSGASEATAGSAGTVAHIIRDYPENKNPNNPSPIINSTSILHLNLTTEDIQVRFNVSDSDGSDTLTYNITWFTNNRTNFTLKDIAINNPGTGVENLTHQNTTKYDNWSAQVIVCDDSNMCSDYVNTSALYIKNSNASITTPAFNQTTFNTEQIINVSVVFSDDDADANSITFEWFKNDALIRRTTNSNLANGTNTTDVLTSASFATNDQIIVQAFAFDGERNSSLKNSTTLTIVSSNSNPDDPTPTINSTFATNLSAQDLNVYFTPTDPDAGETLTYAVWVFENNSILFNLSGISTTQNELEVFEILPENTTKGMNYTAQVILCDDSDVCSDYVNTSQLIILNTGPQITNVSINSAWSITVDGNTSAFFSFSVRDDDNYTDMNNTFANFSRGGETTRYNNTDLDGGCRISGNFGKYIANYSCTINIVFYDGAGDWNVSLMINDLSFNYTMNNTVTFNLAETTSFSLSDSSFTFPGAAPNIYNITASDAIYMNNTGNDDVNASSINITAVNIHGDSVGDTFIPAFNFTVANESVGVTDSCDISKSGVYRLTNKTIEGTTAFNSTRISGTALIAAVKPYNEQTLFMCLLHTPADLTNQVYSTDTEEDWSIIIN